MCLCFWILDIKEPLFGNKFLFIDVSLLLFQAANYLNIKSLLDLTCQTVADMIKGKTPEEIRKTFNIKNDFTPEEEEEVRRENAWAFEWNFQYLKWCWYCLRIDISNISCSAHYLPLPKYICDLTFGLSVRTLVSLKCDSKTGWIFFWYLVMIRFMAVLFYLYIGLAQLTNNNLLILNVSIWSAGHNTGGKAKFALFLNFWGAWFCEKPYLRPIWPVRMTIASKIQGSRYIPSLIAKSTVYTWRWVILN